MSEFEDNLWLEVLRDRGDELARATRTAREHRRASRPQLLAGTTVGLAAIATAAMLLLGASTSAPAFAVTRNPDGTVTVNLMKASGIAGANDRLAAMGVRAQILALAKSAPTAACEGGTVPTITFDPFSIPKREVLMITSGQPSANGIAAGETGKADLAAQTRASNVGGENSSAATSRVGNNHVVRINSRGGQIRINAAGGTNHVARMYCR